MPRFAAVFLLCFIAWFPIWGCGSSQTTVVDDTTEVGGHSSGVPPEHDNFLVWSIDRSGVRTVWLRVSRDNQYEIVGQREEIVIATPDHLWSWAQSPESIQLCDCPDGQLPDTCAQTVDRRVATVRLVDLADVADESIEVSPPLAPIVELGSREHFLSGFDLSTLALGSSGPYLFIAECARSEFCDSTGEASNCEFRIIDLAEGGVARGLEPEPGADSRGRRRAVLELAEHIEIGLSDAPSLELTAMVPNYRRGGDLALSYQYSVPTSEDDADGLWDSGTRSVIVMASDVPAPLGPFIDTPEVVEFYWQIARPRGPAGWSRIEVGQETLASWEQVFSE